MISGLGKGTMPQQAWLGGLGLIPKLVRGRLCSVVWQSEWGQTKASQGWPWAVMEVITKRDARRPYDKATGYRQWWERVEEQSGLQTVTPGLRG